MNTKPYSLLEKYILRTPILSNEVLSNISSEKIKEVCHDPIVSEAIFLASPELHAEMQKYLSDQEYDNPKLELSLLKYICRMGHRCTPFGLFAGISVGQLSEKTAIEFEEVSDYKRATRLDMNYLCSLVQELENIPEIRSNLLYFPNNSLYEIGNKYRYVEYKYKNAIRHHYMIAIDASRYISKVVDLAEKGAKIKDLAQAIVSEDISFEDAENFINNLIDNQILLSSISPTVSGEDYLDYIYKNTGVTWLAEIKKRIQQLDKDVFHEDMSPYQNIIDLLSKLKIPFNKKFIFQTDLVAVTKENELNKDISKDVLKGISILNKLTSRRKNPRLESFKKAFYERYEDEEVPLSIALDVETGVGYNQKHKGTFDVCPLIDDLILTNTNTGASQSYYKHDLGKVDTMIYNKFLDATSNNAYEMVFEDKELKEFTENWNDLPATFPVMCSIFESDHKETMISLFDTGGPSASYLLGRFSHTSSDIKEILYEIVEKEEKEDRILAEIVHLPESRTGNILYRNPIRKHEIAYLAKSNLPSEKQLHISDLWISIQNNTIFLRSKKLNTYVEPRMANAHNYEDSPLPVYQFLGDMQTQNVCNTLNFTWGPNVSDQTFFPRVRYKNVILSPAQWHLKQKEIKQLQDQSALTKWQEKHKIPSVFLLTDHDNELVINLENELSRKMFLSEIKNKNRIVLKENLYNEFDSSIKKGKHSYNNEFIFSLYQ